MTAERWQAVERLFFQALDHPTAEREAFLASAAGADEALRAEVERLLRDHKESAGFLETPAVAQMPEIHGEDPGEPDRIGPYRIVRLLGHGGMGIVYLAERSDNEYRTTVAIKVVPGAFQDDLLRWRFRNERQILANLNHPNIARLFDGGATADGVLYLVMEYVEGEPIDAYCENRRLSIEDRLRLFRDVCSAVSYAHQNLVIHRDIKPSNILVTAAGIPKLLDFGVAKLLSADPDAGAAPATTPMLGFLTPQYASPEQMRGDPITTASDVYSLGVLLYRILSGRSPYRLTGRAAHELAHAVCNEEPVSPRVALRGGDRDVESVLAMALRKQPEHRYASVEQFSADIGRLLEGLPVIARKPTPAYYAAKLIRRRKAAFTAAVVAILVLFGGMAAIVRESGRARAEQARAETEKRRAERTLRDALALTHSLLFDYNDAIARLPGSTELRATLLRDASARLDQLAATEPRNAALQRETAAAYLKIGDILGRPYAANLGDTEGALASYRKASAILERIVGDSTRDAATLLELSNAYESIGGILTRRLDYPAAVEAGRSALRIREELAQSDRDNAEYARLVAGSWIAVGDPLQYQSNLKSAEACYGKALAIMKTLADREPNNPATLRQLGRAHHRVAANLEAAAGILAGPMGYQQESGAAFRGALENYRAAARAAGALLERDPNDTQSRRFAAGLADDEARMLIETGETEQALAQYEKVKEQFAALAEQDPANAESRFDLIVIYRGIAAAYQKARRLDKALATYVKAIQISEGLLRTDPKNYELSTYRRSAYISIGSLQLQAGDTAAAIRTSRTMMRMSQDLYGRGASRAGDELYLARMLVRSGSGAEAKRIAARNIAALEAEASQLGAGAKTLASVAWTLLSCEPPEFRDTVAALAYCRRAMERANPPDARLLCVLAWCLHASGQDEAAAQAWKEALALLPVSVDPGDGDAVRESIRRSFARELAQ